MRKIDVQGMMDGDERCGTIRLLEPDVNLVAVLRGPSGSPV
jgi:hypothetical protein